MRYVKIIDTKAALVAVAVALSAATSFSHLHAASQDAFLPIAQVTESTPDYAEETGFDWGLLGLLGLIGLAGLKGKDDTRRVDPTVRTAGDRTVTDDPTRRRT